MAKGNPLLLAWSSDNTLRSYELSGGAFVQVGTTAVTPTAGDVPFLSFLRDGAYAVSVERTTGTNAMLQSFMPSSLVSLGFVNINVGTVANFAVNQARAIVGIMPSNNNVLTQRRLSQAGVFGGTGDVASAVLSFPNSGTVKCIGYSPDGETLIVGKSSGNESVMLSHMGDDGNVMPTYDAPFTIPLSTTVNCDLVEWGSDSRIFALADKSANVHILRRSDQTCYAVAEISDALGHPVAMQWSPNTRYLAVAFSSGGTPTTVIYRRTGDSFQKVQTLDGTFGYTLGFTADGNLLLDVESKRAFSYSEGVFTEETGTLDNIPAGTIAEGVSPHILLPTGVSRIYDGAISAIVNETIDLANLKIALLSSSAVFNQTDNSLLSVTSAGANEVYGNGWPQGGKSLSNVVKSDSSASTVSLTADAITQTIIENTLTFRGAVIYDATADKPISFIDFQADMHAEKNTDMQIDFSETGFVLFSS